MKICQISLFTAQPLIWQIACLIVGDTLLYIRYICCFIIYCSLYYYCNIHYILHHILLLLCNLIIMNEKIKNIIVFFNTTTMTVTVFFRYFYRFACNFYDYLQTVHKSNVVFSLFGSYTIDEIDM